MKRLSMVMICLAVASAAFANPEPVTNTEKKPYKASKIYCNDAMSMPSQGENISCYNHDACYSDPQGRSREECDRGYLRDMRAAGLGVEGEVKFRALRLFGQTSWEKCRRNDQRQAERRREKAQRNALQDAAQAE